MAHLVTSHRSSHEEAHLLQRNLRSVQSKCEVGTQ